MDTQSLRGPSLAQSPREMEAPFPAGAEAHLDTFFGVGALGTKDGPFQLSPGCFNMWLLYLADIVEPKGRRGVHLSFCPP